MIIERIKNYYKSKKISNEIIKKLKNINIDEFKEDIFKYVYESLKDYNFDANINNYNYLKEKDLMLYNFFNITYNHTYRYEFNDINLQYFRILISWPEHKFKENFYSIFYTKYLVDIFKDYNIKNINTKLLNKIMSNVFDEILKNIKNEKISQIYIYGKLKW